MVRKVGDKMKIYINSNYEIKALYEYNDETLTEIEKAAAPEYKDQTVGWLAASMI